MGAEDMKITVIMSAETFEEFREFQKDKSSVNKKLSKLQSKCGELAENITDGFDYDGKEIVITNNDKAVRAINQAVEWFD